MSSTNGDIDDHQTLYEGAEKVLHLWFKPQRATSGASGVPTTSCDSQFGSENDTNCGEEEKWPKLGAPDAKSQRLVSGTIPAPAAAAAAVAAPSPYVPSCAAAAARRRPNLDLRHIPRAEFEKILHSIQCEILSWKRGTMMDAYILSESSLFVGRSEILLKTCGTTRLLDAITPLSKMAIEAGFHEELLNISYCRKNYIHPELQKLPQGSIDVEFAFLDNKFQDGVGCCFGPRNRDSWYFYTLRQKEAQELAPKLHILMTEFDPKQMAIFLNVSGKIPADVSKEFGIIESFPDLDMDEFLFEPNGYSMNGFLSGGEYVTIHVTPEPGISYVSFESNVAPNRHLDYVTKVFSLFQPWKVSVISLLNQANTDGATIQGAKKVQGYTSENVQSLIMKNLHVYYAHYIRDEI